MQVRFLLGPAGSGKTFRCLAEIREALLAAPDGPPLIFLAPKQATFQLERQLLADPALAGYTRLRILSFERLAEFVFSHLNQPVPQLLAEEGRVMVLRALLGRKKDELRLFRASARLPGFAEQLSRLLRELQQHQFTASKLDSLAAQVELSTKLGAKLHDLALLLRAYLDWLKGHQLEDADRLPDLAAALLKSQISNLKFEMLDGLWLDGFAQMTPQELDLLAALAPHCRRVTLAFCLEAEPSGVGSWLSMWSLIGQTFQRCRERLQALPGGDVVVETLPRDERRSRFGGNSALQHLEQYWAQPRPFTGSNSRDSDEDVAAKSRASSSVSLPLPERHERGEDRGEAPSDESVKGGLEACPALTAPRVAACLNPEGEAVFAAREILRYVREEGGRFRDCAVLLRSFDDYADVLRRIFHRYEIPFFLDRRESVAHHPLAELTRYALRTVAFGWQHDDWFGALKSGLVGADEAEIDRLENEALARGWRGSLWSQPILIVGAEESSAWLERLRQKIVPPFHQLSKALLPPQATTVGRADLPVCPAKFSGSEHEMTPGNSPLTRGECGEDRGEAQGDENGPPLPDPLLPSQGGEGEIQTTFSFFNSPVFPGALPASPGDGNDRLSSAPAPDPAVAPQLKSGPTGAELAGALRELWNELKVGKTLERWTTQNAPRSLVANHQSPIHETVWVQMNEWLRNLERAFQDEPWPLIEWLPVVEAGLSHLSVGVIPPALDQVVVGTIDRSRNPDLRFAAVLGMNESVFPAPPAPPALLSESDRDTLASFGAALGSDRYEQIGVERFYAYIACTRARRRLVLTYSKQDADNGSLIPSSFLDHLKNLFPNLPPEEFSGTFSWTEAVHASEAVVPLLKLQVRSSETASAAASWLGSIPSFGGVLSKWRTATEAFARSHLSPELAARMYGPELRTSVSALEDFAACSFKYFAARGLRAEERIEFEVDHREKGSFQHEALRGFQAHLQAEGKRWRDLAPDEARQLIRRIGKELLPAYRDGLFLVSPARRFAGQHLIENLEKLVGLLVAWAQPYQFDPQAAEVSFGLKESGLPAWRIDLDGEHALLLRGRIDRVDLCRIVETGENLGVVIDYKSSARELDATLLHHGLELQLLAYLGALTELGETGAELNASHLQPAGAFYVALRGAGGSAATRLDELEQRERARREGFQHRGRFDAAYLDLFDNRGQSKGDQFKYLKNKDGTLNKRGNDALPAEEFQTLVARVKEFLRRHGQAIFAGQVEAAPYRWRNETACDFCAYRPVCRFDPWTQPFRVLRPPPK
ncbi:MAG: PD-(D/E)XK nuclease family protein [Verrucomicrobia bacterium]|nr:PD-(D/E)XK nuclease family protein [Verrucomicrobiota bacterium]